MSEHGAALQTYNLELVKCLEELKMKRKEILEVITKEESDKAVLEQNIRNLQEKLNNLNKHLQQHKLIFDHYEKAIIDTENGFKKILESSQALLNLVQLETNKLESTHEKGTHTLSVGNKP